MRRIRAAIKRITDDEAGGEIIEYALILGLISVTAVALIAAVGTRVLAKWTSINAHSF